MDLSVWGDCSDEPVPVLLRRNAVSGAEKRFRKAARDGRR